MKPRTLAIAVLVLAVLSAADYWINRPAPPAGADPRVGQPLLGAAAMDQAAAIRISNMGQTVALARGADGLWIDSDYYDLPADFEKLSGLVHELASAQIVRLVTTSPDRIAELGFQDTRIEFRDAAGNLLTEITLGDYAEPGGRFLRFGDEAKAYLTTYDKGFETGARNWADDFLLNLKDDDIARLKLPFADGRTVVFTRTNPAAAWTAVPLPPGRHVRPDQIDLFLTSFDWIRYADTDPIHAPIVEAVRPDRRTYEITTFDGTTYTVVLGRPAGRRKPPEIPADRTFAIVRSSDPRATVNAMMARRAFQVPIYRYINLPQTSEEMFTANTPPPAPAPAPQGTLAPQ